MKLQCFFLAATVLVLPSTSLYGIQVTTASFSSSDPVITFETGSTALPTISGLQFSGGDASFSYYSFQCFGSQYFGDLNEGYLDIYFTQPQQAVGAYIVNAQYGTGVIEVVYDQSNNVIETESALFPVWGAPPVFLGIGEPTAQIYRVEWQCIGGGYFGVDNVIYGGAVGLSQMPNIPTGLTATLQGSHVLLNWSISDRATSYNVKRANAGNGSYATIGSEVTGTNYTDTTVTNGGIYYYVVTAVNAYGQSAVSHQVIAFIVDHFAFTPIASPQTSSVPFIITISACDSNGLVLSNFTGAGMLSGAGDHGIVLLTPPGTSALLNGRWTGAVTVAAANPDSNIRLTCSSNGVMGMSNPFNVIVPAIQEFNLTMADLVYNPFAQRLYAAIPVTASTFSNSLLVIDPALGRIETSYYLGDDPSHLAVSSDGQFVYIGFNGTNVFRRFNLATHTIDLEVALQNPTQIATLPGMPHSVAVTGNGTAIFDDGIQRSNTYPFGGIVLAGSANKLFAMGGAPFAILTADTSGITGYTYEDGIVGWLETFKYQAGLIFTSGGTVFNPDTATIFGHLTNCSIVEPDLAAGRIFSMGSHPVWGQPDAWTLYAWNATNLHLVGSLAIPGVNDGGPTTLIRWGTNGIAFSISSWYQNQLFLVRSSLIPPVPPVLTGGSRQASGPFQLNFTGDQSVPYTVWASTNLANWTQLGMANLVSNGCFWFLDLNASNCPRRFYRAGISQ